MQYFTGGASLKKAWELLCSSIHGQTVEGGNSSSIAATLCQTRNNKDCQAAVFSFMASLEHKLPRTPSSSTLSPPSAPSAPTHTHTSFQLLLCVSIQPLGFLFKPTVFHTLLHHLSFEGLSCFCLEFLSSFCSPSSLFCLSFQSSHSRG